MHNMLFTSILSVCLNLVSAPDSSAATVNLVTTSINNSFTSHVKIHISYQVGFLSSWTSWPAHSLIVTLCYLSLVHLVLFCTSSLPYACNSYLTHTLPLNLSMASVQGHHGCVLDIEVSKFVLCSSSASAGLAPLLHASHCLQWPLTLYIISCPGFLYVTSDTSFFS